MLGERLADRLMPHVLADRHTHRQSLDRHGFRQVTRGEIALLIENVVIGQFDLVSPVDDGPVFGQDNTVVELAVSAPDGRQQDRDVQPPGRARQRPRSLHRLSHELALEQQIFGEVPRQVEFGEHQDVRTRRLGLLQRLAGLDEIFSDGADFGV